MAGAIRRGTEPAGSGQFKLMDSFVFAVMLLAAALHAGWNALLKLRVEPRIASTLLGIAGGIVALPFCLLFPLPAPAAWPFLAASGLIHLVYFQSLGIAYETGDLGQVYPLARGSAPLLTAIGAMFFVGEGIGIFGWVGVTTLALGVVLLSLKGARDSSRIEVRAVGFALLTAASIGAYTVVDGIGVRLSGHVGAYVAWNFVAGAVVLSVYGGWRWRGGLVTAFTGSARMLLLGAAMSIGSYGIALWAMTQAPIAIVGAMRETSVLFAALIGVVFLGEPLLRLRIMAGALVLAGVVLLRMA
ncbi:MAG: EamA family transporter [Hyphomicrobium sp.]|nr:EamA family transporter [Hyphomicrobium sp.]